MMLQKANERIRNVMRLACPRCGEILTDMAATVVCPSCGTAYTREDRLRDLVPLPRLHERHSRLVRGAGHFWRWFRSLLFLKWRYDRLRVEEVLGYSLVVLPGVFNPALFDSSQWPAKLMDEGQIAIGSNLLDMGTGAGLTALCAASRGSEVVAVDVNPAAVRCARINALLNGMDDRIDVRESDLFGAVKGDRFDTVLFNPPFYEGVPADALDRAWRGRDIAERFARGLQCHLRRTGTAYLVLSSRGIPGRFLRACRAQGFAVEVVRMYDLISETQAVYSLSPG